MSPLLPFFTAKMENRTLCLERTATILHNVQRAIVESLLPSSLPPTTMMKSLINLQHLEICFEVIFPLNSIVWGH